MPMFRVYITHSTGAFDVIRSTRELIILSTNRIYVSAALYGQAYIKHAHSLTLISRLTLA